MVLSREVHLVRRPRGRPEPADVQLVEVDVPNPPPGQVLVRNLVMSVEPYMRGRMSEQKSYVAPYDLNAPMSGHAVGEVVAGDDPALPLGTIILHEYGWREYGLVPIDQARAVDCEGIDPSAWLGALGLTGMTAWVGLTRVVRLKPGETVFVSAAAGAVGSTAGQIAKVLGCTVIGSCGSQAKADRAVRDFAFDHVFNYHDGTARQLLRQAVHAVDEEGLDVYFDNVGGEQLEAAIREMREFGRLVLCGAISVYNATEVVPGPTNLLLVIWRSLQMTGFLLPNHEDERPEFEAQMTKWIRSGSVINAETVAGDGIDSAFDGFLAMLDGQTFGKAVVRLAAARTT